VFENEDYTLLEKLNVSSIIGLYERAFDIDVSYLFNNLIQIEYREHKQSGIRFFEPAISADGAFYEKMQKFDWYYQKSKSEYDTASKYTKNKKILEIGSGYAYFYNYSGANDYTGLEYNQQAVDTVLQRNIAGLKLHKENIETHAKNHLDSYDTVCSFQVLEHVLDPVSFIENSLTCCKRGGYLIFSVPAHDSFIRYSKNNILNMPPHHLTHWPDRAFKYIEAKYKVELVELKHESLDAIHRQWFLNILGKNLIKNILCLNNNDSLIAQSFFDKILSKCGNLVGRLLSKGYDNRVFMPVGHTVTAIFKKL
jgi:SAM-dependent methyltransferase